MSILITLLLAIAIILIIILIYLFASNKSSKKEVIDNTDVTYFINRIKKLLETKYPNLTIDYEYIENILQEKAFSSNKEMIILEEIIKQFIDFTIDILPNKVPRAELWGHYEELSFPMKNKIPKDFQKRKITIYMHSGGKCQRCGTKLRIEEVIVYLIKSLEKNGTYHLENLLILCSDCYRVLTVDNLSKIINSLHIYDNMLDLIERKK